MRQRRRAPRLPHPAKRHHTIPAPRVREALPDPGPGALGVALASRDVLDVVDRRGLVIDEVDVRVARARPRAAVQRVLHLEVRERQADRAEVPLPGPLLLDAEALTRG